MDEQTRYRVTGSLFLLAVAIICLPMLFDGDGVPSLELPPMAAPAEAPQVRNLEEVAPASDFIARVDELRAAVDEQGFLADSGTRFGEPVLREPGENTSVWAVQVASFADAANAQNFRAELREQGYEAFISTVKTDEDVLQRVAVGPLLDRGEAEALRDRLSGRYGLDALLVAFSN